MDNCYNMITGLNNIENIIIKTYNKLINIILSVLGIGGIFISVLNLIYNEILTGIGYMITSVLSCVLLCMINRMHVIMSIQSSIDTLKLENEELKESNDQLLITINELKDVEKNIKEDVSILKSTIGIVGENADEMINNLKKIHDKLKIENNRHVLLIKSQTSLQLMHIFNHFDNDQNLMLDETELEHAKQSILNILPELNWDDVASQIKNKEIKLETLLSLL